ncbi:MAG: hypothetical protein GY906_12860 [bacterium]|nr:hypothetical protein [bacterium]
MSDTFRDLLHELTKDRECYCFERPSHAKPSEAWCLPCRAKAALKATQPWEDEREALRSALAGLLKLVKDMTPLVIKGVITDYALLNEAPITARNLLEGFVPDGNALRPLVKRFAQEMERKLRKNDHKDGCFTDEQEIIECIYREMCEISESIRSGGIASINECADAGNFLAMLAGYMRSEWPDVNELDKSSS